MLPSNNYIVVEKVEEEKKEGFVTAEVTDASLFTGRVTHLPEIPVYLGNNHLNIGDKIYFSKYSPDTHEIEHEGKKLKFIAIKDILAKI